MIFADILFWFLVVLGAYLALNAYWLAAVALFRPAVERAHRTYATRPVAATLVGLVALVPVAGVLAVFSKAAHPGVKLLAGAALLVPLVPVTLIGSAGLADRIGTGLAMPVDAAQTVAHGCSAGARCSRSSSSCRCSGDVAPPAPTDPRQRPRAPAPPGAPARRSDERAPHWAGPTPGSES